MTTFTKTLPTEPGWYYWRENKNSKWKADQVHMLFDELLCYGFKKVGVRGGEWGGRVPAPGTTWNVEQFMDWVAHYPDAQNVYTPDLVKLINDPQSGIAATTARHRREQG